MMNTDKIENSMLNPRASAFIGGKYCSLQETQCVSSAASACLREVFSVRSLNLRNLCNLWMLLQLTAFIGGSILQAPI
jgi:hypothetical protein